MIVSWFQRIAHFVLYYFYSNSKLKMDELNSEIRIIEKNDETSYEDIYHALWEPLEDNKRDCETFVSDLQNCLGNTGVCYIALHGDEIVGTLSAELTTRNKWFARGPVVYYIYARVAQEWQGQHINSMLTQKVFEFAALHNCNIVTLRTGPGNKHAIAVYRHYGFKMVRLFRPKGKGFTLVMVKYLAGEQDKLKVSLADMGIRILLPFYRTASACRNIFRKLCM